MRAKFKQFLPYDFMLSMIFLLDFVHKASIVAYIPHNMILSVEDKRQQMETRKFSIPVIEDFWDCANYMF